MMLIVIVSFLFLAGCNRVKITDFKDLKDLPKNPSRIVYVTNLHHLDENGELEETPVEYEIQTEKIDEVVEILFSLKFGPTEKYKVDEEPRPIQATRYLVFYDEAGRTWKIDLEGIYHKKIYYRAYSLYLLTNLLQKSRVQLKQGTYKSEDHLSMLNLFGDDEFDFSKNVLSSVISVGNYSIVRGKLVLKSSYQEEYVFEIRNDCLVFISSNNPQEKLEEGKIFVLDKDYSITLKQGYYFTSDNKSKLSLFGESEFVYVRTIVTSYYPTGTYTVEDDKLILNPGYDMLMVFYIGNDELVFISGELAEPFVTPGTIYKLLKE